MTKTDTLKDHLAECLAYLEIAIPIMNEGIPPYELGLDVPVDFLQQLYELVGPRTRKIQQLRFGTDGVRYSLERQS